MPSTKQTKSLFVKTYNEEVERLLDTIRSKWGTPNVSYLGKNYWRVSVSGFHIHHSCGYSSFCADGADVIEAATRFIENTKKNTVGKGNCCERGCSEYVYDGY